MNKQLFIYCLEVASASPGGGGIRASRNPLSSRSPHHHKPSRLGVCHPWLCPFGFQPLQELQTRPRPFRLPGWTAPNRTALQSPQRWRRRAGIIVSSGFSGAFINLFIQRARLVSLAIGRNLGHVGPSSFTRRSFFGLHLGCYFFARGTEGGEEGGQDPRGGKPG